MEIYQADILIDGTGAVPLRNVEVFVQDGVITDVVPAGALPRPAEARLYARPGMTMLPGLIDAHTHLMFGDGARTYLDVIQNDPADRVLLRAARNAYQHLRAGVTLLRDCGAQGDTMFHLKQGAEAGLFVGPRLQVCGRPITCTGGHFYFCGEEADGVEGVRQASRKLLKQGADFLKIMSGGGGGTPNSDSTRPSYSVAEMAAAVQEAHAVGHKTAAHCLSAEGLARAVDAGIDQIEHLNFLHPDGTRRFDERSAEKILRQGTFLSPTISTGYRQIERLQNKRGPLTPSEQKQLDENLYKLETKLSFVRRFHEMGAPIVAGTDATPAFGDYAVNLELLNRAGLAPMEVIVAATSLASRALGTERLVGTLRPGLRCDLIYVDGDPLADLRALNNVAAVVLDGRLVVDKTRDLAPAPEAE